MNKLAFGKGNAKVGGTIHTFSLPAGWSCPFAEKCFARAKREDGSILESAKEETGETFRCFAASMERLASVRDSRWANFDLLKGRTREQMRALILASLPKSAKIVRVHVSGDFFNEGYFLAWMDVASIRKEVIFYAYTKSIGFWVKHRSVVPANFELNASYGGKNDALIAEHGLKYAKVVFSRSEALELGLEVAPHDSDHLAYTQRKSFALLLHGVQKSGTVAAKALSAIKVSEALHA